MRKLLILGIPFDYRKGGAEYQYKIFERYLKFRYEIYYLFRHPESINNQKYLNYDYRFRKRYNPNLYTDAYVIYRMIKSLSPDIIYKRSVNYIAAIGAYYAKSHKSRMVLHIASERNVDRPKYNSGIDKFFGFLNQNITKYAIKNANQIVCQTEFQNKLLKENFGRNCDLILPNVQPIPENIIKKSLPTKVVWISNLKPLKQPELYLDLVESFHNNHDTKFIMIGRPATGEWQRMLINRINRLSNLEYRGELSIEKVNKVLRESHILVNTSEYEGFPNTYIQAWMRKVPVVTLNSDPDDIIKTYRIGFHSKTFQQMVQDVKYLIKNKKVTEKMGIRAKNFACNTYSTANIEKFINLIENVSN